MLPPQNLMGNAAFGAPLSDLGRLFRCFRPEAMIDRQSDKWDGFLM